MVDVTHHRDGHLRIVAPQELAASEACEVVVACGHIVDRGHCVGLFGSISLPSTTTRLRLWSLSTTTRTFPLIPSPPFLAATFSASVMSAPFTAVMTIWLAKGNVARIRLSVTSPFGVFGVFRPRSLRLCRAFAAFRLYR